MARVAGATAARNKSSSAKREEELYPSINTLRSVQEEEEEEPTCLEWSKKCCQNIFNFTLASCQCFTFLFRRSHRYHAEDVGSPTGSAVEDSDIREMKERLSFHFMNPFQKWKNSRRRRFPWKLLVQMVSIVLVTTQLILFAGARFALTDFILQNQATFSQLFVANPQQADTDDPLPSPIATLYTHDDLERQLNHTIEQYFSLKSIALGTYGYGWHSPGNLEDPSIQLLIQKYNHSSINPATKTFVVSSDTYEDVIEIKEADCLNWTRIRHDLSQTIQFVFRFDVTAIFIRLENHKETAECVQFHLQFLIENDMVSGSMPVRLTVNSDIAKCSNNTSPMQSENTVLYSAGTTAVDAIVMVVTIISLLQCMRSLMSSWKLSLKVKFFFQNKFSYRLKYHQILPLYNMWFLGVIVSNLLVLLGCILKLLLAFNVINNLDMVDITSIVIGLAVFGQWSCLLRFLSYFDKYNMLLITLRLSLPSVIRFIICTGILYIAFLLCGWLVLGPYHPKFRDPFVTSECLFSLINGDDMFATYKGMSTAPRAAYIFSKIYLYVFIALFIYVVLSVFISLISDTYETLHEHWYERSKGLLVDFALGKLGQPHYHTSGGAHTHTDTEILHDDQTAEEDYEYLREASNRFGPNVGEVRPLICNGGPELRQSNSSISNSEGSRTSPHTNSRGTGAQLKIPRVQIQGGFIPGKTDIQ